MTGIDCFTDYYPRADQGSATSAVNARPAGLPVRRRRAPGRRPRRAARRRDPRLPPGGAGRRAQELGTRLPASTPVNNIEATQLLLEACVGRPLERLVYASSSSVYGDDVQHPDAGGRPAAAGVALRRDASWPPSSSATCTSSNHGVPTVVAALLHGVRPAAAARHGRSTGSCGPRCGASRSRSTATASRRATSRSWPTPSRRPSPPATEGVPGPRLQHRRRLARLGQPACST